LDKKTCAPMPKRRGFGKPRKPISRSFLLSLWGGDLVKEAKGVRGGWKRRGRGPKGKSPLGGIGRKNNISDAPRLRRSPSIGREGIQ